VGPDEDRIESEIRQACGSCISQIGFAGYTDSPALWLAASNVLCLPSYREGFGTTIIEAASAGLPAIGSRIYGITDAIDEGVTGLLHIPGDVNDLAEKMRILAENQELRRTLGFAARERAHLYYSKDTVTAELLQFYERALGADRS
jgi:glycosyltransferase involved in cell wall biosynthesis